MPWEAWFTIGVVVLVIVAMARNVAGPDLILLGGLALLVFAGVFSEDGRLPTAAEAVAGFGNEGLMTVAVLFVVVAGLTQTGAMSLVAQPLLGRPGSVASAQTRLMAPVAGLSAFLNNTTVVAMFMPVVSDWCKKAGLSPSKLFMPLSYAAVLGGVCSLIGTSTNIIVNGLAVETGALPPMGMFEVGKIGAIACVVGLGYVLLLSRWLLPERTPAISSAEGARTYTVEMLVARGSPLVGQTIEQAGLRHLPGLYLAEIERGDEVMTAVEPTARLYANDRLVFVGVIESVVDLQKIRGLVPATNQVFKLDKPRSHRSLIEAVVSNTCPLVGKTIREGRFRSIYRAVVIAAARGGERIAGKIGDIVLRPGDTLLLEADPSLADRLRNSRDFFLVSKVENSTPLRHERAWLALLVLALMVIAATAEWVSTLTAALVAGVLMILTRCCSGDEARRSIDYQILVVIGLALGLGSALQKSGAAQALADAMIGLAGANPWITLVAVYAVTLILTELITNNAAAVLVFPIALAAANGLGVNFMPFAITIMIAASCGFATPLGYQTHLMVYGPGGYRFMDFVRMGLALDLLVMAITVTLAPVIWPLSPV